MQLGKLERVELREVWKNEERDFSKWLATPDGIKLLGEAVGFEIEPVETESTVGRYYLDILAKVAGSEQTVVIENQIEDSNHDHLGKLLTYAAGKDASCAIWIVKHARDEHRRAVEFLNETSKSSIGYFLLEIEAWKIGDSPAAPKFNVVEAPNNWAREIRDEAAKDSEISLTYQRFWTAFCDYANADAKFRKNFNLRKPAKQNWMDFSIGRSGLWLSANVSDWHKRIRVALVMAVDYAGRDKVLARKDVIREEMGEQFAEGEGSMKTFSILRDFDIADESKWNEAFAWYCKMLPKYRDCAYRIVDGE